ncbi:hypothetical protein DVH24_027690 [Malus domestica]|uniref:Reverse transcriptase zinc-binding domain-containing protein n=1 Tax=Malus domestica TaxID=3750 RepID=A0A498HES9_MALDO|nr:hypothetical protein DVH24_027690 [Malus domestica]
MGKLHFTFSEINLILSIPLSLRDVGDRVIWHFERERRFSVRGAYHFARSELVRRLASNSQVEFFWRTLWKACILGKVKICVWRSCYDALPTHTNLLKRKVIQEDGCISCGQGLKCR